MMVTYQDCHLKSITNEFDPPLTELQLNIILNRIPDDPEQLIPLINEKYEGKILIESISPGDTLPVCVIDYPVNKKIALFCELYEASVGIKYKAGAADAGKIKTLAITPDELRFLLEVYFKADLWYLKPKSIANFIKKYNEIRALALSGPEKIVFPLPFDPIFFNKLNQPNRYKYWDYLRANGYRYIEKYGQGGEWKKGNN